MTTQDIKLTPEQKQQFIDDGYLILRNIVPDDVVARTRTALLDATGMTIDDPETWDRDNNIPYMHANLTVDCINSAFWQVAEQLAGPDIYRSLVRSSPREGEEETPDITGFIPVLIFPTPGEPKFEPGPRYHIDGLHMATLWPDVQYLTGFMYLTDVADYGGATALCPGGHRKMFEYWHRRSEIEGDLRPECTPEVNFGEPVPFVGNAGDIVFMHYLLPHEATPNHSSTIRMALNGVVLPSQTRPYQRKEGPPTEDWTPLDWTLRTDNL